MLDPKLSAPIAHRIDQQIKRAFRHTYSAESGLRMLVRLGVEQMARGGATQSDVRTALVDRIAKHAGPGKPSLLTGESRSVALAKLVTAWADEAYEENRAEAAS